MAKPQEKQVNKAPVAKFAARGVKVDVWENPGKEIEGKKTTFLTVSIQRSYKDADGDWQNTGSMRVNDLPVLKTLLSRAYEYAIDKKQDKDDKDDE